MAVSSRPVGSSGLSVSELGFGAASIGNLYTPVCDRDARSAIDEALASGIQYFDTAPHYGRGLSERRIGDALRLKPDVVVSTKVGRLLDPDPSVGDDSERDGFRSSMPFKSRFDYSYDGILRSHDHSLQRLGLPQVDFLFVHDIGTRTHGNQAAHFWTQLTTGGGFKALEQLRGAGLIKGFGVGANETAVCLDALREAQLDLILLAGRYTLLEQQAMYDLFPACEEAGASIIVGGPYNSGILASGVKHGAPKFYDYGPAPDTVIDRVAAIETIADRYAVPLPAAALAFVLAHPLVASVIPGVDSATRVARTVALYHFEIPSDFWEELRSARLLAPDAVTPDRRTTLVR